VLGDTKWRNYEVTCDVLVEGRGYAAVFGRVGHCPQSANPPQGYCLKVDTSGTWSLLAGNATLARGPISFAADAWHNVKLRFSGPSITAAIDGAEVKTLTDWTFGGGMAGVGSGWHTAEFDDFRITPIDVPEWKNFAVGAKTTASSTWADEYGACFATDGDTGTRWNCAEGKADGEWLEIDWGRRTRFGRVAVHQFAARIAKYRVQYAVDGQWRDAFVGERKDELTWSEAFPPVESDRMRFLVERARGGPPSIYELEVYD
jgi:hypothetical protein